MWIATLLTVAAAQDLFIDSASRPGPPPYPVPSPSPPEVKSFTVHVIHRPQDTLSVAAKDALRISFCKAFSINPCAISQGKDESILHIVDDLVVSAPFAKFHDVASFFMQHRVARLNPPATVDLDLVVHPNTAAGPKKDFSFGLWAGEQHPVDMNAVYKQTWSKEAASLELPPADVVGASATDEDKWAYTCSYDAGGEGQWVDLCSKGPYAMNTTCRSTPVGAHIHVYYSEANADEVRAKAVFSGLATKALNLSLDICHDNYGHEQPHNTTCWLGGPTHMPPHLKAGQAPGPPPAGSFVEDDFSLYVTNEDFAKVASWIMLNDLSEVLGKSLNFLLHPVFGCNFADHQMWSLHKGSTPNNLYGVEDEGGWTGKEPSRLDPLGPDAGATCACATPAASSYALHLLYDATDKASSLSKEMLVSQIVATFDAASLQFVKDVPHSYTDRESPFLAGQVHFKVKAEYFSKVLDWLSTERGSTDVLIAPVTCCGEQWDYTASAIWAGHQWPLNVAALKEKPALPSPAFLERVLLEESPMASSSHDVLLYVNYASANAYQAAAVEKFLVAFAGAFKLERDNCTAHYPAAEPHYSKLCMMSETKVPSSSDPVTTAFAGVYVPASDSARVLSWAMLHRGADTCGYQVDLLVVPLTGDAVADYSMHAFHVGTAWGLNDPLLLADTSSGETAALNLPSAVHYYRNDNVDQYTQFDNGATLRRWDVVRDFQADWPLAAPFMIRHEIPAGATFPSWGGAYWFQGDSYSTVISGNATFGNDAKVYGYGDLFWSMAGHAHGPITNVGNTPLVVSTISSAPLLARRAYDAPDDMNPSVDASLIKSRGYRRLDRGQAWAPNPSPHSTECMAAGGVYNMGFDSANNTNPVLRVKWAPNCSIPYHYHPTGALYFIQYGKMFFRGDLATGGEDISFKAGEVRWVRPGFDYGPEYNSADEHMEITVLGTDTPPMFQAPPPGPYKYQKTSTITTVFDEL